MNAMVAAVRRRLGLRVPLFHDPEYDLARLVRRDGAELIARWGLREVAASKEYVLHRIVFRNDDRMILFAYDVGDGYLAARYGPASLLKPDGTVGWPTIDALGSLDRLIAAAGLPGIPVRTRAGPSEFAGDVRAMLAMVERFEATILGPEWTHDGEWRLSRGRSGGRR